MSDTCYMEVMCLREHQKRFIVLGFHLDNETENVAIMVDFEANFAHFGKLPTDIPYTAFHSYGGDYGPHLIACDGKRQVEIPGDREGFVIKWNHEENEPGSECMAKIREYLEVISSAQPLLDDDSE